MLDTWKDDDKRDPRSVVRDENKSAPKTLHKAMAPFSHDVANTVASGDHWRQVIDPMVADAVSGKIFGGSTSLWVIKTSEFCSSMQHSIP